MSAALTIPLRGDWRHRYQLVDATGAPESLAEATPSIVLTHKVSGASVTLTLGEGLVDLGVAGAIDVDVDRLTKANWPKGQTTAEILLVWSDGFEETVAVDLLDVHGEAASTGAGTTEIRRAPDATRLQRLASGPPGPPGVSFTHVQTSASALWTINHNLGFRPVVTVLDAGGREVLAEVTHVSDGQLQVAFASPAAGRVRCV